MAATTLVNNNDQINNHLHQPILTNIQLFSLPGQESVTDFDGTTLIENNEKQSSIKYSDSNIPIRLWSNLSTDKLKNKNSKSRLYRFIQLERALIKAKIFNTNKERMEFENEYLKSIEENRFEKFLEKYYQKLQHHFEHIQQENQLKQTRIFTFHDLEKNFLALDPTRNVKIIFLDEPTSSSAITTNTRSSTSAHQRSASATTNVAVESFYAKRSQHLIMDPSRARDEITLFARKTAEHLHEQLPRLTDVPHRVKILDERDTINKSDERTLLQLKHKHALSLINKRRHIIFKMMTQNKKNQIKIKQQWNHKSLIMDNSSYCHELLERANQIEQIHRKEQIEQRPQTTIISRRLPKKNISSLSTVSSDTENIKPFQDALSIKQIEKTKDIRIILPTRPLTAPMKVNWVNYC